MVSAALGQASCAAKTSGLGQSLASCGRMRQYGRRNGVVQCRLCARPLLATEGGP